MKDDQFPCKSNFWLLFPLLIVFMMLFLFSSVSVAGAQGNLKIILQSIQSIQADFNQEVFSSGHKLIRKIQGHMAIMRPNHFRWDIETPIQQLTIADGKFIYVYDPDLKQVTQQVVKSGKGVTPAMILSGASSGILNDFFITQTDQWFLLEPKVGDAIKKVGLKFSGNVLTDMKILDGMDQTTLIHFTNIKMNGKLTKKMFDFSVPKGVDKVQIH